MAEQQGGATRQGPTEEDKAKAEEKAEGRKAKGRKADSGPYVQWTGANAGIASERKIPTSAWGQLGISKAKPTVFDVKHGFRLPESDFNEEQLDYLYNVDGFFIRTDAEGNPFKDGE